MAEEKIISLDPTVKRSDFPHDFLFGVGSAAYQVEGAWNEGGKGLSIWDCFTLRTPENIVDGSNGCVAVDSYHRIKEDVQLLKKMGVNSYRFSISWPRILPGGKVSMGKNIEGINYYNSLIDELIANNIEPLVTLFHWDLPNALEEEYMGFLSPKIVEDFVNYAELCFWEFGDRVKHWVTSNEPYSFIYLGYVKGTFPPARGGKNQDGDAETEPYLAAYHMLNCHAAAYRKYEENFDDSQKGQVGITLVTNFYKPFRGKDNPEDVKAAEYALDFMLGWFLEPITSGEWPISMQKFATTPSLHHKDGRSLPAFTAEQKKMIIKSYDFLGINYYTSNYAEIYNKTGLSNGYVSDHHFIAKVADLYLRPKLHRKNLGPYLPQNLRPATICDILCHREIDASRKFEKNPKGVLIGEEAYPGSWVYLCPNELVDLITYIMEKYKVDKHILITENGAPQHNIIEFTDDSGIKYHMGKTYEQVRDDKFRLKYLKSHLDAIRRVNKIYNPLLQKPLIKGYFYWSFTDNFEWSSGYTIRFGMNYIDYQNGLQRYPKNSALWYKKFLSERNSSIPFKRPLTEVEQEDEANGAPIIPVQTLEGVQKLKKAKVGK